MVDEADIGFRGTDRIRVDGSAREIRSRKWANGEERSIHDDEDVVEMAE